MQDIIDGKIYDTENAEKISRYTNMYDSEDFNWFQETLYRTESGNWFLHGKGNANSKYKKSVGTNKWRSGEVLKAFSEEEAYEWLETHGDVETMQRHFDDRIEAA